MLTVLLLVEEQATGRHCLPLQATLPPLALPTLRATQEGATPLWLPLELICLRARRQQEAMPPQGPSLRLGCSSSSNLPTTRLRKVIQQHGVPNSVSTRVTMKIEWGLGSGFCGQSLLSFS